MAWLPENSRHDLLAAIPADQWNAWADGASIDRPRPPQIYGCRINTDFADTSEVPNIIYKKGMQGQFLGLSEKGNAQIFIRGVTEGKGFNNRYVPAKFVDKGKRWSEDVNDWRLDVNIITLRFDARNWTSASLPDTTLLGKTVTRLISAFRDSPPPLLAEKLTSFLDKANITALSHNFIRGVKDAGLYDVLAKPNGNFSSQELVTAAKYRIDNDHPCDKAGIYVRFHKASPNVVGWEPNTTYCYVGKSTEFITRFKSHVHSQTVYGNLTRGSSSLRMIALCIIDVHADDGVFYLFEQLFVCLLQTYRDDVIGSGGRDITIDLLKFAQPAKHFTDIADEVFRMTGWRGGVRRASFQVARGVNCSSPLTEYGTKSDKMLFIRTDVDIKDGSTGVVTPMAFYRRSNPVMVKSHGVANKARNTVYHLKTFINKESSVITFSHATNSKKHPGNVPIVGQPYEFIIEVRKDGTPHPHAWARCPDVGRFENWRQANSFAVRIEWQDARDSGKWKFRYLQATHPYRRLDETEPGSLATYGSAIAFLQYLTHERPNHNHKWIPMVAGAARVLQANYNFMDQSITFTEPTERIPMLSGRIRSDDAIIADMKSAPCSLENVNAAFGDFHGKKTRRNRHMCDTCTLVLQMPTASTCFAGSTCTQVRDTKVCSTCVHFGRPCYSWSADLESESPRTRRATSALVKLPIAPTTHSALQGFSQILTLLASPEQVHDDASDCDDDDDDDDDEDEEEESEDE
jgi:hypothetical protein